MYYFTYVQIRPTHVLFKYCALRYMPRVFRRQFTSQGELTTQTRIIRRLSLPPPSHQNSMNCNTQLDSVNLTEPTEEYFRPYDSRDNRNLPLNVFERRNLGFCRHRETAATQITRTYEAQARAAIEVPNVHHALEAYDLYPHILTEG